MSDHPGTAGRSAALSALLLTLAIVLTTLLPTGGAWAAADTTTSAATTVTAAGAAAEDCAVLPLASFGDTGAGVGKAAIPRGGSACFTFTAEQAGLHYVAVDDIHAQTYAQVFDGDTQLDCYDPTWGAGWCRLSHAGVYTLQLVNNGFDDMPAAVVSVVPLATTDSCSPETGTSYADPPLTGSVPGVLAIMCQPFTGRAGERITVDLRTTVYGESLGWITDGTGAHICPHFNEDDSDGCVLPGDGPYRVLIRVRHIEGGFPADYRVKIRRLSEPQGCVSVPINSYNSAPTTPSSDSDCKVFTAPAAGRYAVYGVPSSGSRSVPTVYDHDGKTVCETWVSPCTVPAAGKYTLITDSPTLILDRAGTAGCEPVQLGTYRGAFTAGGEVDCLTLPLPEGARMAALTALSTPGPDPDVTVVDADGTTLCDTGDLSEGTCALTGRAPYRALVSADDGDKTTGSYAVALYRTDATSTCQTLPVGDFTANSPAASFSTGDGVFSTCLSIPANAHSPVENVQLQAVSGSSPAQFSVLDASGKQVCSAFGSPSTWTTCTLTPGVAHTVLVTGADTRATYTLTRRDVTATAKGCAATPATAVGGPSTGGALGAPGTLLCRKVTTGNTTDTLHLNVRDALGTANLLAFDADGKAVCGNINKSCAVTGSTSYQVLVTVPRNLQAATSYRFDALRIATAAGPAAECTAVPNVSYGYGPITGTLDEQHTAVCAALPTAYNDRFDFTISDTAGGTETAVPALYGTSLANNCVLFIPSSYQCYMSEPYSTAVSPSILVIGLPEKAAQTSYSVQLDCTAIRCGAEKVSVTGVSPTTSAAGGKATLTVTGTALHEDDKVRIYQSGTTLEAVTTAVSADRKSLTAVLDLTGAMPGTWSLSVITHNSVEYSRGTFTVTEATLTNTAAPKITGSAQVGVKLTVSPGTWTPAVTSYAYQWKADGTAIAGATASSYTVPASVLGKKLTVVVSARRTGYVDGTATTAAVTVAKGVASKVVKAPVISGTARVGVKLTVSPGTWTPAVTSYAYQWKANGVSIAGATASSYTVPASVLGKKLTVVVSARRTGYADGTATTAAVTVAKGVAPKVVKRPTISGTAKVGRTLKASHGTWTPAPTSYLYRWYANGKAIAGATKSSLILKSSLRGKKITVKVAARRTGHAEGLATSTATRAVAR
ncbi:hypothetical protein Pth03_06570 [Planotetraspora thailandica]|uniref:IPT/TIG domain-containing protein n=1 Tax=Planotetraspora thailandica TaxID=487172 RepID=A0A8J3UVY3_9ACTN|nr:hypothetical protein [Planotetraspora thailandica]GII52268.1 hypothetical protein Pth03_06570 [Planotetraspora thailandica]